MYKLVGLVRRQAGDSIVMTLNNIIFEKAEHNIRIVKISRPAALNALNRETLKELHEAFLSLEEDRKARVIILTGDGEKAFIAGADVREMASFTREEAIAFVQLGQGLTRIIETLSKPVIAAVNGFALGGGTELALSCDFILASENAVFGQPEVGLGILPGFGATVRLARSIGLNRAREWIFTGRKIKALEAFEAGLVSAVYPTVEFTARYLEFALKIAHHSPLALRECKRVTGDVLEALGMESRLAIEASAFSNIFGSFDQVEGMTAFIEKRKPIFSEGIK